MILFLPRNLAAEFSLDRGQISRILSALRDHIYRTDAWLQRSRNLHVQANLEALYEECHQATLRNERITAMYQHLCGPNERLGEDFPYSFDLLCY